MSNLSDVCDKDIKCEQDIKWESDSIDDGSFKLFIDNKIPETFNYHVGKSVDIFPMNQFQNELTKLENLTVLFDPFSLDLNMTL